MCLASICKNMNLKALRRTFSKPDREDVERSERMLRYRSICYISARRDFLGRSIVNQNKTSGLDIARPPQLSRLVGRVIAIRSRSMNLRRAYHHPRRLRSADCTIRILAGEKEAEDSSQNNKRDSPTAGGCAHQKVRLFSGRRPPDT